MKNPRPATDVRLNWALVLIRSILTIFLILTMAQCRNGKSGRETPDNQGGDGETVQSDSLQSQEEELRAEAILTARTMGLAYLEENELDKAETEFEKLIELAPGEAIGYANLGLVCLRTGRYDEAEKLLLKARELDPQNPDIRLNLARVYEYLDQGEKSIEELEKTIAMDSAHVQTLYTLAESYGGSSDKYSMQQWERYMKKTVEASPANIVPRLHLTEVLLRNGKPDEALVQLEELERIFPDFPSDAHSYHKKAMESLHASDPEEALTNVLIFHNTLKLTNQYHSGIAELKGYSGTSVGNPVFSFSETAPVYLPEGTPILEAIKFRDVTESAGLAIDDARGNTHFALGDLDHDGDQDIYLGTKTGSGYRHYLLQSEMGRFKDIANDAGLTHRGVETYACFADFDNDGWVDLYVVNKGDCIMYRAETKGTYENVTKLSDMPEKGKIIRGLLFDMDHEGDLDAFLLTGGRNILARNNGDKTFTDVTEAGGLQGEAADSRDACYGDFDDDGDIDLFVLNSGSGSKLWFNQREGRFKDMTAESGLTENTVGEALACGDYDNDGYLDLLVAGNEPGTFTLFRNRGNGSFDPVADDRLPGLKDIVAGDVEFFDFDNDGRLDLLVSGIHSGEGRGLVLLHNEGEGRFSDVSRLLPEDLLAGGQIGIADYNEDGDLDIFLASPDGGIRLLRNDGGNANYRLQVRLVGIKAGSGKNNHYGIGSKVEVRAGDHYQMKVVTEPVVHFGLGKRSRADVVRILWTNGTPQNIFSPGADQDLVEEQQLKGSCPFLYTWDGSGFTFVKDIMWHSALGMPMGIMGGNTTYGFPDASRDYMLIPGEKLKARDGKLILQVTEELWETIYLDEVELIAVDYPEGTDIRVNEKFSPPPYPEHRIYNIREKIIPVSARDGKGNDLLELLREKDDVYVSNFLKTEYQGITEVRELILDPGTGLDLGLNPPGEDGTAGKTTQAQAHSGQDDLHIFLNGWIFPTDASINWAIAQSDRTKVLPPNLQVMNRDGEWETVIENLGFPAGKDKTVIASLEGKYLSEDRRVRILTNMEIYWDHAFFAYDNREAEIICQSLRPESADHHYRGFSRLYRKNGRYGPHWFDYNTVSGQPQWRDLAGTYTRFGDVTPLLEADDNMYIIANAGEETTIVFDTDELDDLPDGWTRDYVIHTVGWVKDGDMNTALGNTAAPLPFHGMSSYPYGPDEAYPDDRAHRRYMKKYNTRWVDTKQFRQAMKVPNQ